VSSNVIRITELLVYCLPFIKGLAMLGVIAAATVYLFHARFERRWVRVFTRAAGAVLVLPLIVLALLLLTMVACESRPRILVSPDSQHIAEYSYEAGFLGRDSTFVSVRKRWSVLPDVAYEYQGPSDWSNTEVRWLGNGQLLIRYHADTKGRFQQCNQRAAGIMVQCVTRPE
jgi:hypothetical protein